MHIRDLDISTGAEQAGKAFDFRQDGKGDIMAGISIAYSPAIEAACNHAAVRITDIAQELGLTLEQTTELYRMYMLGVSTMTLLSMIADER